MFDFSYYTPTQVVFGRGTEDRAGELVKQHGGSRVLLHYGGHSALRPGLIDRVMASLDRAAPGPRAAAQAPQKCSTGRIRPISTGWHAEHMKTRHDRIVWPYRVSSLDTGV